MDRFTQVIIILLIATFFGLMFKHKMLESNYQELIKESETLRSDYIRYRQLSESYKQEIADQVEEINYIEKQSQKLKLRYETRINYIDSINPIIADSLLAAILDNLAATRFAKQDSLEGN